MNKQLILDPKGYFIIRIKDKKIEVGFCHYNDMVWRKYNKILKQFSSENPEEILKWIKKNSLVSRDDHYRYMVKELKRAGEYIKNNNEYVQD